MGRKLNPPGASFRADLGRLGKDSPRNPPPGMRGYYAIFEKSPDVNRLYIAMNSSYRSLDVV